MASRPACFGTYEYEYVCFRCDSNDRCLVETREREGLNNMARSSEESKEERKDRLDKEWEQKLPCVNCHPKMQKLCKYYNTFKRPDYNAEQFHIGEITCNDIVLVNKNEYSVGDTIGTGCADQFIIVGD